MKKNYMKTIVLAGLLTICLGGCAPMSNDAAASGPMTGNVIGGVPNPMHEYANLDAALAALDFACPVPHLLPAGYAQKDVYVIGGDLLQITYALGTERITYRASPGDRDISGIYGDYPQYQVSAGNIPVTVKHSGQSMTLALWQKDGLSFSLEFSAPVETGLLVEMISSVK